MACGLPSHLLMSPAAALHRVRFENGLGDAFRSQGRFQLGRAVSHHLLGPDRGHRRRAVAHVQQRSAGFRVDGHVLFGKGYALS